MPSHIPRPCIHPSCGVLITTIHSYCEGHKKQRHREYQRHRPEHRWLYSSPQCTKKKAEHIKAELICNRCRKLGRRKHGNVVGHIVPISAGGELLAGSNL